MAWMPRSCCSDDMDETSTPYAPGPAGAESRITGHGSVAEAHEHQVARCRGRRTRRRARRRRIPGGRPVCICRPPNGRRKPQQPGGRHARPRDSRRYGAGHRGQPRLRPGHRHRPEQGGREGRRGRQEPRSAGRRAELGGCFTAVAADAADPNLAGRLIDAYRPAILVLNAGATPLPRPIQHHTWQTFSRNWEVDVQHVFNWIREALLAPLEPGSTVITLSSGAALRGSPLSGGYAGAKAAIRWLTGYAAEESGTGRARHQVRLAAPAANPRDRSGRGFRRCVRRPLGRPCGRPGPGGDPGGAGRAVTELVSGPGPDQGRLPADRRGPAAAMSTPAITSTPPARTAGVAPLPEKRHRAQHADHRLQVQQAADPGAATAHDRLIPQQHPGHRAAEGEEQESRPTRAGTAAAARPSRRRARYGTAPATVDTAVAGAGPCSR